MYVQNNVNSGYTSFQTLRMWFFKEIIHYFSIEQ